VKSIKNSQHLKLNEAINFQNKGDNKKAVFLFLQVLKSQPTNTLALYSLAAIESNTGNNAVALTYANRAIASNQNFAQAYLARSTILLKLGKLDEALADVDMALALDADLAGARVHKEIVEEAKKSGSLSVPAVAGPSAEMNSIALKLQDQGKLSEAQQVFRKVAERYPDDFIALYSLGVLESRSGNPEQAMHWMSKAVESNPTNSLGHYALATILQGMALYEQALDSFDAALELNPNYMEAYNNKVLTYFCFIYFS
jgi:tetratricopeptide (TPR) repeat protein